MPSPKPKKSLVQQDITYEGQEAHPLEALIDGGAEFKCVGMLKIPGHNTYAAYTVSIKGDKVTKVEASEPDLRAIAEEGAKTRFVHEFMVGDAL